MTLSIIETICVVINTFVSVVALVRSLQKK